MQVSLWKGSWLRRAELESVLVRRRVESGEVEQHGGDRRVVEVGATSLRDIGRVMADVMPQVSGRADGGVVSQIVKEKLA